MSLATQRKQTSHAVADLWQNTFFGHYWRAIGIFLGRGKAVSIWKSAAVVMIANLLLGVGISALLGETRFITIPEILKHLMWITYTYSAILLFLSLHSSLLEFLSLRLVASIETERNLQDLQTWATR